MSTEHSPERGDASRAGAWPDHPTSGAPDPTSGAGQWQTDPYAAGATPAWSVSGAPPTYGPASGPPVSGPPTYGPASGPPVSGPPTYGPASGPPVSGPPGSWPDPLGGDLGGEPNRYQRRIEPTVPERKNKLVLGLLAGFLAGALVAGPAAWFLAPRGSDPAPAPTTGDAALGLFEKNQLALNQPKFQGDLAVLAASWLPFVSNCLTATEKGGPKLDPDMSAVVLCRYGNVFIHFIQFKGPVQRDVAQAYRVRLNTQSRALAPGMGDPEKKPSTSDPVAGTYVEYALPGPDKKPTAGIWWDTADDKAVAIYLEAGYQALGQSWEPLRDLWQRRS